ncbi:hypothetical protein [Streptomyces sp. NPDC053560]|uniref:hypothetical protein n=1 Tax=Streptomyces sp. NPDC053560 TaxID=3365711 RepID=UPI0037D65D35
MKRLQPGDLVPQGWNRVIDPRHWASMTRMHEATHVTASEALGIPVESVWANVDPTVRHGGQYRTVAGDSQLQTVVYLIGAEGGAQELRDCGYDEDLAHNSVLILGGSDMDKASAVIREAGAHGYRLDGARAQADALALLHSPGFKDTAHSVADALACRGDRLTGADVRAAIGDWQLDGSVWVRSYVDLDLPADRLEPAINPAPDIDMEEMEL